MEEKGKRNTPNYSSTDGFRKQYARPGNGYLTEKDIQNIEMIERVSSAKSSGASDNKSFVNDEKKVADAKDVEGSILKKKIYL